IVNVLIFFFSSRRRHTRSKRDWSSDVCSSDLLEQQVIGKPQDAKCAVLLKTAIEDSFKRLIEPSVEREIRNRLTEIGEEQAISEIGRASCRERGEIKGGEVGMKRKKRERKEEV